MKKTTFVSRPAARALTMASLAMLLFSLLVFSACSGHKKQTEALIIETTELHEEAMKNMADMNRLARELKQTMVAAMMAPEQSAAYNEALEAMGKAENNMMDWMKNYKLPTDLSSEEALKYMQDQKAQIEKTDAEIMAAMEAGKKLLGK